MIDVGAVEPFYSAQTLVDEQAEVLKLAAESVVTRDDCLQT